MTRAERLRREQRARRERALVVTYPEMCLMISHDLQVLCKYLEVSTGGGRQALTVRILETQRRSRR